MRAEKVSGLADSLYEGKSRRVQQQLKQHFDLAMERDAIKWNNVVTKKDGQRRVAQFHEDRDEYVNHMIQAADGGTLERAQAMWSARLESIKPYMGPAEFVKLRDQVRDTVKFKRAWNDITGEGEFDPSGYMDLNPDQLSQLQGRHRAMQRENLRQLQIRQADRITALVPRLEDSLASARQEGVPMDGTDEALNDLSSQGQKGAELAAQYREQFSRSYTVWDTLDSVKHQPFAQQLQAVESLRPEAGSEGYRADMEMYQAARKLTVQKAKAFAADSAGYVQVEAEKRAAAALDPWVGETERQRGVIKASMELQRELGAPEPKILPKQQAQTFKDNFERADGQGKADFLTGLSAQYGDYDTQVLHEMGLGMDYTFAAEAYMDDPFLGRKMLAVMDLKESEIAIDPATAKDIGADIDAAFFVGGMGELQRSLGALTGNPNHFLLADKLHAVTRKYALANGDASKAMNEVWLNRFNILIDDDVLIYTPKSVDADDVADRLRAYRERLPDDLAVFKDGVWKNSHDSSGYVLVLPHGGTAMARDGQVVVVHDEDLEGVNSAFHHTCRYARFRTGYVHRGCQGATGLGRGHGGQCCERARLDHAQTGCGRCGDNQGER